MGWKGTVRSMRATGRRIDRDAKRRQKELEKQQKELDKMQELEQAAYEVEVFENYLELIQSVHKDCSDSMDWQSVKNAKEPVTPILESSHEKAAQEKLNNFKPNFINKLLGNSEKKKEKLQDSILQAKRKDAEEFDLLLKEYKETHSDWEFSKNIAGKIIKGNSEAKLEAIREFSPFAEIDTLGSSINISIDDNSPVLASINIHSSEIVPSEQKSLLKSGKLSVKKMPVGKFNEIFQDYVCSVMLRVANEIFAIVPDQYVIVNVKDKILNTASGHIEEQIIVSAYIPRKTIQSLNMQSIDPSDSMSNFVNNMNFKKTKGFLPVEQVEVKK
ncbi:MAG: Bud13/CWC26 family protein [Desulfotalea sp.]